MEKALIVDDSRLIRKSIKTELEKLDYEVYEACDGAEALAKVETEYFDVITLDMVLPDGTGLDLCQLIKSNPIFEKTVIMIITSNTNEDIRKQCFKSSALKAALLVFLRKTLCVKVSAYF
jgi:CheY-like chemotaxis protein